MRARRAGCRGESDASVMLSLRVQRGCCSCSMDYLDSPFVPFQLDGRIQIDSWNCFLQEAWNCVTSCFCWGSFDEEAAAQVSELYAKAWRRRHCVLRFLDQRFELVVEPVPVTLSLEGQSGPSIGVQPESTGSPEPPPAAPSVPVLDDIGEEIEADMRATVRDLFKNPETANKGLRKLLLKWHPDRNPKLTELATKMTQIINSEADSCREDD
eukprot:TRINITY_DN60735_c0_g1_i1.p1 TRINITY_DN60735_c0_g1~~TRINITY_DN60735_c0_g1_i1.p1  ORF type:complete len:212 (-),score=32.14 TRINITY_DN60735_c0_g1_i1:240-875(-)